MSAPVTQQPDLDGLFRRLVRFFRHRHRGTPDQAPDLAQETIARGLLAQVERGGLQDPVRFFWAVAQNVSHEHRRSARRAASVGSIDGLALESPTDQVAQIETRIHLQQMLRALDAQDRQVLTEYYTGDRQALRQRLGVSEGALRLRVHRLRRLVESQQHHGDSGRQP